MNNIFVIYLIIKLIIIMWYEGVLNILNLLFIYFKYKEVNIIYIIGTNKTKIKISNFLYLSLS